MALTVGQGGGYVPVAAPPPNVPGVGVPAPPATPGGSGVPAVPAGPGAPARPAHLPPAPSHGVLASIGYAPPPQFQGVGRAPFPGTGNAQWDAILQLLSSDPLFMRGYGYVRR